MFQQRFSFNYVQTYIHIPIWLTKNAMSHAKAVVYDAANNAHFQLPASCLIATNVATHGK